MIDCNNICWLEVKHKWNESVSHHHEWCQHMVLVLNYHHQPHPVLHTFKVIASPAYSHMGMYEIFNPVDYCKALDLASSTFAIRHRNYTCCTETGLMGNCWFLTFSLPLVNRGINLVVHLGWVWLDFQYSVVCPVFLGLTQGGLRGIWQKSLSSWARRWNIQINFNLTELHDQMNHPVPCRSTLCS